MASITDGNYMFLNQGKNPLVNFNFMLRVELVMDLPCKSVRAFERELEYDYIQEGGLNDYVHMRRKPISSPYTLEIERYVGVDYIDPLPLGADLTLPLMLFVSRVPDQFVVGVVARTYIFTGCTVMKKSYGDLVAEESGLLVETTTIGYREMLCVDIPWSEVGDNMFASTPSAATNSKAQDKSAQDLKAQGQDFYGQALQAKNDAEQLFDKDKTGEVIKKLEEYIKKLRGAINGGKLQRNLNQAEAGMNGADGKTLKELADAANIEANQKELALKSAEADKKEAAQVEWQLAAEKSKKAVARYEEAETKLAAATQDYKRASAQINRLQNCLTNLKTWKDKGVSAQQECSKQHDICKSANDVLQALSDEPLANVNAKFEEVKKSSKEAVFQQKQTKQAQQYVEAANEEIADTEHLLPSIFAEEQQSE